MYQMYRCVGGVHLNLVPMPSPSHIPNGQKVKVKLTCIAPLMKLYLKALRYGSHRVAPANYTIPASTLRTFARWHHLNDRHLIPARYSFIDPRRMKGWVGLVGWPISGRYTHISGHTSAADREAKESSPVRDWRSNHWATQPTKIAATYSR